ncbi:MAG: STAS-like domain-containing protein [Dehalococcoidia bacterium]
MASHRASADEIRQFILKNVTAHPKDITRETAEHFNLTRQRASQYVRGLVRDGQLQASGNTKARSYELIALVRHVDEMAVTARLEEHVIWRDSILPYMHDVHSNVLDICQYGLTEMVNNVVSHADARTLRVTVFRNPVLIQLVVDDDGIGIFRRIQETFGYDDPRHALLELSKGKITSDPDRHTGEGIFFTSKMFDDFTIWSGGLFYSSTRRDEDWLLEVEEGVSLPNSLGGTFVSMEIYADATQTTKEIFDQYASADEYDFSRTHVPILLAKYESEQLVSRSQARRVLARFDRFKEVMLDFQGVEMIGQAFADEIFRVFRNEYPGIEIVVINTAPPVMDMINRAKRGVEGA